MLFARCFFPVIFIFLLNGCGSDKDSPVTDSSNKTAIAVSTIDGYAPLDVRFTAQNVDAQTATWEFDDGSAPVTGEQVQHTFSVPGVYTVTLTGQDSDGQTVEVTQEITVHGQVNLVVSNFAIAQAITPGQDNIVSATVQNIGSDPLDSVGLVHVGYYLSTDDVITVDDIRIGDTSLVLGSDAEQPGQQSVGRLEPQQAYSFNHRLHMKGNIPPGSYFAGAIIDYLEGYGWYEFPTATQTQEYEFPVFITVAESDESDNVSVILNTEVLSAAVCTDDGFEDDDSPAEATVLTPGAGLQRHNLCLDNADWYRLEAVEGTVYEIVTTHEGGEVDTQMMLYDQDGQTVLLFDENGITTDLTQDQGLYTYAPPLPAGIVWRAPASGTYYVKVRTATCDEDIMPYCEPTPLQPADPADGVGAETAYTIQVR